jgi:hypothetical protein
MALAITTDAVERGVQHALSEIRSAIAQIAAGEYPQYDDNCRRDIGEWLDSLDGDRERQIELGGGPFHFPLDLGLRLDLLPRSATRDDIRRWQRWVTIEGIVIR